MKLDEDVKMISAETPLLISKACELFIIELAFRGWTHTIESNRRTLQRNDIAQAISHNDFYDFLLDIVEESCKNKLFYSAHSYSKNPSIPTFGLFDNFHLNEIKNTKPAKPEAVKNTVYTKKSPSTVTQSDFDTIDIKKTRKNNLYGQYDSDKLPLRDYN